MSLTWSLFLLLAVGLAMGFALARLGPWVAARRSRNGDAPVDVLAGLLARLLGAREAQWRLAAHARARGVADWRSLPMDAEFLRFAEAELDEIIGPAGARAVVASAADGRGLPLDKVLEIIEEARLARVCSRELAIRQGELETATAELRAANERLREVDRLKDDFVSTVTHELRTPLTSIRALSEMLRDDPRIELAERQRFLDIVVAESERLGRLIDQLLDMARLESGRAEWLAESVDLGGLARDALAALDPLFREKGVALAGELPAAGPVVRADRDRLMQVLVNLLSNAVKFAPAGNGTVRLSVGEEDGAARVAVVDNGPGLTAEDCAVVFEKFRQGGDSLTGKPKGTGLGLPISRRIIERFGGKLWVESSPGRGAAFIFTVPLPAPEKERGRQEQ